MSDYFEYRFHDNQPSHSHSYLLKTIVKILGPINKSKILDVGCGNGSLAIFLINRGYDVYGIDASINGIKIAKSKYTDRFYIQNIKEKKLPSKFSSIKYNTIISTEVIEHLFDPKAFIEYCKEILLKSSNGKIIISTPYHGYLKNLIISLINGWDIHLNPLWDGGHIKLWLKKTVADLLTEFGFLNIKIYGCGRVPLLWQSMIINGDIFRNE